MAYLPNVIFAIILIASIGFFVKNVGQIRRNINLGRQVDVSDQKATRFKNMARIAMGQTKMVVRPVPGLLHILVYLGFIVINLEVLEIIIDGLFGTHRIFAPLGAIYTILIATFEVLAVLVIIAVILFWIRRNILRLRRFIKPEMKGWPKTDANLILYIELALMLFFLTMNAADFQLQQLGAEHYTIAGAFPVSSLIANLFTNMSIPRSDRVGTNRLVVAHCRNPTVFELSILFQAFTYFISFSEYVLWQIGA